MQCCLFNIHSVGDSVKAEGTSNFVSSKKIYCAILIETWLCQDDSDTIKISDLTTNGTQFLHKARMAHRGGGIGVHALPRCRKRNKLNSFEYLDMDISSGKNEFCLIAI